MLKLLAVGADDDKPHFVELAEKELHRAVEEWIIEVACEARSLTAVEERLFRAATNYVKAKRITGTHKIKR